LFIGGAIALGAIDVSAQARRIVARSSGDNEATASTRPCC
jgi:hypothetical protein